MSHADHPLKLAFGFSFEDLYTREGAVRLDAAFLHQLQIDPTATIPAGTAVIVFQNGNTYFMQVPVWL